MPLLTSRFPISSGSFFFLSPASRFKESSKVAARPTKRRIGRLLFINDYTLLLQTWPGDNGLQIISLLLTSYVTSAGSDRPGHPCGVAAASQVQPSLRRTRMYSQCIAAVPSTD